MALDAIAVAVAVTAAPALTPVLLIAITISLSRIVFTTRAVRRLVTR
jgi:predicted tellurium resistance membrane protein TerC